jgi:hypothetical protein
VTDVGVVARVPAHGQAQRWQVERDVESTRPPATAITSRHGTQPTICESWYGPSLDPVTGSTFLPQPSQASQTARRRSPLTGRRRRGSRQA